MNWRRLLALGLALMFVLVSIAGSGIIEADEPSIWIITGEEVYNDTYFLVENDVIVEEGGHLVFENCTVVISDSGGAIDVDVIVLEGGLLETRNSSISGFLDPILSSDP